MEIVSRFRAMRLWEKNFGAAEFVTDFAGRNMDKSDYLYLGSEYGWTCAPILPTENAGSYRSDNLVCCHLLTANEKLNKFPSFKANGRNFEIVYRSGKYEVRCKDNVPKNSEEDLRNVDFSNALSGTNFYKGLRRIQGQPRFVGTILIRMACMENTAVVDFVEKFFETENITYSMDKNFANTETRVIAKAFNLPLQDDTRILLDKCVVLNTYMQKYFLPGHFVSAYDIYFRLDYFEEKSQMYLQSQNLTADNFVQTIGGQGTLHNSLFLSKNVIHNTYAGLKVTPSETDEFTVYSGIAGELASDIEKETRWDRR